MCREGEGGVEDGVEEDGSASGKAVGTIKERGVVGRVHRGGGEGG